MQQSQNPDWWAKFIQEGRRAPADLSVGSKQERADPNPLPSRDFGKPFDNLGVCSDNVSAVTKLIHAFGCRTASEKRSYQRQWSFLSRSERDLIFPVRKPRPRGAQATTATPRTLAVAITKGVEWGKDSHSHDSGEVEPSETSVQLSLFFIRKTTG